MFYWHQLECMLLIFILCSCSGTFLRLLCFNGTAYLLQLYTIQLHPIICVTSIYSWQLSSFSEFGQAFFTTTFSSNNNLHNGQCNFHNLCTRSLVLTITTLYPTLPHYFIIIWYFIFRCLEWQNTCTETSKWGGSWAWWDMPRTRSRRLYQHHGFWLTLSNHLVNTWACGQLICTYQERRL